MPRGIHQHGGGSFQDCSRRVWTSRAGKLSGGPPPLFSGSAARNIFPGAMVMD